MNASLSEMNAPTISVVIPLYNKGKYIERALSSVSAQTNPPLEIIVVDDGSTDDGPEKVRKLSLANPTISLIRQENRGPGAARNAGLARAKGKYVAFLDADDEWLPHFLEEGLQLLEDESANVSVVCTGYITYPAKKIIIYSGGIYTVTDNTELMLLKEIIDFASSGSFIIMRTEVAKKWDGYFDQYKCLRGEDKNLFIKLLFNETIGIVSTPCGIYHKEASDLTGCVKNRLPELNPFFKDANQLFLSCPQSKRRLLQELLFIIALDETRMLAMWGRRREAKELFKRFGYSNSVHSKKILKIKLLIEIAPLLPGMRKLWHAIKPIVRRNIKSSIYW
jgi:glycosyltransferase involved in cell wall biosynthesis